MSNNLASGSAQTPPAATDTSIEQPPVADDQAPPADPLSDPPADGDGGDPPKKRTPAEERIAELAAERTAAMEYGNYWRGQATAHLNKPPVETPAPAAAPASAEPPLLTDFPAGDGQFDAIKWSKALTKWNQEQIAAGVQAHLTKHDQAREQETVASTWQGRVDAFAATHPDFAAVTGNPRLPIDKPMADAIRRSELGADIFYYLGNNPAEAARISRGTPQQQRDSIVRLEGKVEALRTAPAPRPAARTRTGAPPPPAASRPSSGGDVNLETCSLEDFMAARLPAKKR